jgi:hypothetical protein
MPWSCAHVNTQDSNVVVRGLAYLAINHEANDVLNVVIRLDTALNAFPHALPIGIATFDGRANLVDELRVGHCDLKIGALCVALEAVDVFSVCNCNGMNCRLVLRDLCFEVCFVGVTVLWLEVDWCCDIEVVLEVGHM